MTKRISILLLGTAPIAFAAMFATAAAQDAGTLLQAADRAMGASAVSSIQYSATGWMRPVGQSFAADDDWPRLDLKSYSATIDYGSRSGKEEYVQIQGNNPAQGGGFQPIVGERRTTAFVSGSSAWNLNAQGQANPQPNAAEERQFMLWTSPHGFIKAAQQAQDVSVLDRYLVRAGRTLKVIGFTTMGKYRVTGEFNDQNLLERVVTWIPNPMMGDMQVEIRYSDYRDVGGGAKFPYRIHAHQGDHPFVGGRNWLDLTITQASANIPNAAQAVPDNVRNAAAPRAQANSRPLGNGVWLIGGAGANSVAIEFRDFITVVEGPDDDARSTAVIAEVKRVIPNKPIRYLVNTHHHWDHAGGIRGFAAAGATIVTHESNRDFYEEVVLAPQSRSLEPDSLSRFPFATTGPGPEILETFADRYAISDGTQTAMVYHVANLGHAADMAITYVPSAKILISADMGPPAPGAPAANVNASTVALYNTIRRLGLDVAQHVPIHGNPSSHADFERTVGPVAAARAAGGAGGAGGGGQ
jgi:glyoxylase-like metal-dependent hydrolase (beta-lactamase superfamily II)